MTDFVYLFLAEGFEEIEAITVADILRRLDIKLILVGVTGKLITGSHGIEITTDITLNRAKNEIPSSVILPGGMPGAKNLDSNADVKNLILRVNENNGIIGAICAAPMIIGRLGLLRGKKAVCFPGFEEHLIGATISKESVVRDGNIITASGAGAAADFGFMLGAALKDEISTAFVKRGMQYRL